MTGFGIDFTIPGLGYHHTRVSIREHTSGERLRLDVDAGQLEREQWDRNNRLLLDRARRRGSIRRVYRAPKVEA